MKALRRQSISGQDSTGLPQMMDMTSLGMLLDSLEEGVLFLDIRQRVVASNKIAEKMLANSGSLRGRFWATLVTETYSTHTRQDFSMGMLLLKSDHDKFTQNIELTRPTGDSLFLRLSGMRLPSDNPELQFAIIMRDRSQEAKHEQITEPKIGLGSMVGQSSKMQRLYEQILRAASSSATVLVSGESGTGKELVARALHDNSPRAAGPFIPIHCASLPESLLESELFGHAKGAFTGATTMRPGRFEAAQGGTLLLDEIGEISPSIQVKLLRVLQEKEVVRLGENQARRVDVRVVAATHRDLSAMVARGDFREDLYYRLRVLPLEVPALRERKDDIAQLASKLLADISKQYARENLRLAQKTIVALEKYDWPGNIRQLSNALEYAAVHADNSMIQPNDLPPEVCAAPLRISNADTDKNRDVLARRHYYHSVDHPHDEMAKIQRTLAAASGNKSEAARNMGMSRTTLWKKLRQES